MPSQFSFLDDYPSIDKYDDIYGRTSYAASVAKHIACSSSDVSFAVAIIGDWGSGKSDFLVRLKSELKNDSENIIFDFNPWRVNKSDAIIEEFFKALSKQLQPYNQSIAIPINDYSNRVLKSARETQLKMIDALIGTWFKEDDIQEKYDTINNSIKATSKRIVIFIDDVDRLTGKEVMEVLRIIRNTANFANTFFIVGIDQNYIVNVLKNTKDFDNEEEYLKKVFQLTLTLPAFKKDILFSELKKYLFTPDLKDVYKERINSALKSLGFDSDNKSPELSFSSLVYDSQFEKLIDNVRDLKRFCNSFKLVFDILKDEADIQDLIMLELIRNKSIEVYNSIRNRSIVNVSIDNLNKMVLIADEWKKLEELLPENDRKILKNSIEILTNDTVDKNQRKFALAHNFYIYFSYQLFNLISFHDFNELLIKSTDEIVLTFTQWIHDGKERELDRIISNLGDFENVESFKKMIIVFLRLADAKNNWFNHARQRVYVNWEWNHTRYFESNNDLHERFLCYILNDKSIDPFVRSNFAQQFIRGFVEGLLKESTFFTKKKNIRNLIYNLFNDYLLSNPVDPYKTLSWFYCNDYKVINNFVVYFPPASKRFKNYLLSDAEGFQGYVKTLLRPAVLPYNGKLVLEPWIEQIFPDLKIFEQKLSNTTFTNEDLERLRKIILKYYEVYFNSGKKPFEVANDDDKIFIEKYVLQIENRKS